MFVNSNCNCWMYFRAWGGKSPKTPAPLLLLQVSEFANPKSETTFSVSEFAPWSVCDISRFLVKDILYSAFHSVYLTKTATTNTKFINFTPKNIIFAQKNSNQLVTKIEQNLSISHPENTILTLIL